MELNKLYNMDCMIGMKEFPDNFFDLAIVDPPYLKGIGKDYFFGGKNNPKGVKRTFKNSTYWNKGVPNKDWYYELCRISKNQIIWGCNYFSFLQPPGRIIWDKKNETSTFSHCEIASCSLHDSVKIYRQLWNGYLRENMLNGLEKRIHPTQKPIAIYKWQLRKYATPDMKIIDTHVGSGSSIIAFEDFGCKWIGFEIDKDYYEDAIKRIKLHKLQLRADLRD